MTKEKTREYYAAWLQKNRAENAEYQRKYRADNREALKVYYRARYAANRDKLRGQDMRRKYGIGLADYDAMLEAQGRRCAICGATRAAPVREQRFHIDHDHKTKEVRGLLCSECNIGLGKFKDSPALLKIAAAYLEKCQ